MIKKDLIDTQDFYLRLKHNPSQADLYFNKKNNPNYMRGHAVITSGAGMHAHISLPHYLRNNTGVECYITIEEDGIHFNVGVNKFRF